jgi:signal transduction histidine kinase
MRRQASAISASGIDRRLTAPLANDEIRRLAETLNEMLSRLERAMRHERRFVDDASHELRTPLTALKAELDLARARPRSIDDLSAALSSASEETDRLARLADDLLLLSRSQNGRVALRKQDTSLRELVDASARTFTPLAEAAGIKIVTEAPDAHAVIDGVRVRQAIDNLLDNAIRHSRTGGAVHLAAQIEDGSIRITVDDEGPGFTAEFLPEAFEPFRRAIPDHANGLGDGLGAGLGLAIVRAIAESHGGFVTAENRRQGGARVSLMISPDGAPELGA